uniref:C-type lectin domain-containing protein n=1 Tax=Sinocyclocheilus rhinocerous TaxID=307959 RepID=A0A673H957_9TELE
MTSVLQRRALISFPSVRVVFLLWFTECFSADSHCDEGYLLFGEHCYHFETETVKNWQDAENYCVAQNGHLVNHFNPYRKFPSVQASSSWVGLNDIDREGTFVWSDGTQADFQPWETNQPDNWQNNEDCVHIRGTEHQDTGKLNDLPCSSTYPFICQKASGRSACLCLSS